MKNIIQKIYTSLFEKQDFFEMSNIQKEDSGLDFIVWVSTKTGKESHWARVKVTIDNNNYSATISENPKWIHKPKGVSENKLNLVLDWVKLNYDILIDHWNGVTGSKQFLNSVRKI